MFRERLGRGRCFGKFQIHGRDGKRGRWGWQCRIQGSMTLNPFQLTVIEPRAFAGLTGVDPNAFLLTAHKMLSHGRLPLTFRTSPWLSVVDLNRGVDRHIDERSAVRLIGVIQLLKLDLFEPHAAAAAMADIEPHSARGKFRQFAFAGRAFHRVRYK